MLQFRFKACWQTLVHLRQHQPEMERPHAAALRPLLEPLAMLAEGRRILSLPPESIGSPCIQLTMLSLCHRV